VQLPKAATLPAELQQRLQLLDHDPELKAAITEAAQLSTARDQLR
jgi:hypothetical protein